MAGAAFAAVLIPVTAFILLEGASSLLLLAWDIGDDEEARPLARLRHTRFDPELGWAHIPGVRIDDLYGPGAWLQTNSQGFRAERDFSQHVPPGRLRVICSGDSFTLGYGVANDETWCARLEAIEPHFETVNMGQGGYGIDQAWLWYRRDGVHFDHHVHVFAFISDDFRRMQDPTTVIGYGKPVLALRNGELVVLNTPVPRRPFYADGLAQLRLAARALRASALARRLLGSTNGQTESAVPAIEKPTLAILRKMFEELLAINRAKGSQLVLVYLPTPADWKGSISDGWRSFVRREARARGIPFLDLVAELRRLPQREVQLLFIGPGVLEYRAAAGHLTPKGNAWVAERLHANLVADPSIAAQLGTLNAKQDVETTGMTR